MDTSKIEENTYLKTEPTADTSYHSISQLRSRVQMLMQKFVRLEKLKRNSVKQMRNCRQELSQDHLK